MRWMLGMLVWLTAATSWAQATSFSGVGTDLATASHQWTAHKAEAPNAAAHPRQDVKAPDAADSEGSEAESEDSAEAVPRPPSYINQNEWITLRLGGGAECIHITRPGYENSFGMGWNAAGRNLMISVGMLSLSRRYFYATLLELNPVPFIGDLGLGMRFGGRIPLRTDWSMELRLGTYAGGSFTFLSEDILSPRVAPFIEFHASEPWGGVGMGVSVPITFLGHSVGAFIIDDGDRAYTPGPMIGGIMYFAVSFGRSAP